MNRDHIRKMLLAALGEIAPELEISLLDPARPLRHQVDLDSADWLNFLVAVQEKLGVDVPDAEAGRLRTLEQLVQYCEDRLASRP